MPYGLDWAGLYRSVEGDTHMKKFAAYTEETIWAVAESEEDARAEAENAMEELESDVDPETLKVAPIDDDLVDALAEAEETDAEVLFDLIDGELCEVETVD